MHSATSVVVEQHTKDACLPGEQQRLSNVWYTVNRRQGFFEIQGNNAGIERKSPITELKKKLL